MRALTKNFIHAVSLGAVLMLLLWATKTPAYAAGGVEPDTGFEVEGNLALDGTGTYDWENAGLPDNPAVLIQDPHSKSAVDPNIFKPAGKFADPANWSIQPGSVGSSQAELTNILAWAIPSGDFGGGKPSHSWIILGMERTKKEGTFALDFELNQNGWDGASGTLVRKTGDISVGFELSGNPTDPQTDLKVLIVVYDPNGELDNNKCTVIPGQGNTFTVNTGTNPCPEYGNGTGWFYRFLSNAAILSSSGYGVATMNDTSFLVSDGAPAGYISYDAQGNQDGTVGPFEFAEAAIDLTNLGLAPGCPGFGTVHAKSRSSLEVGSDLKDLAGPQALPVQCKIEGTKYLDVDADGTRDPGEPPLEGWEITLTGTTTGGESVSMTTTTDADGHYEFDDLADGTYAVSEVCPAGWAQTDPGATDFAGCGSFGHSGIVVNLANRIHSGLDFGNGKPAIDITKTCTANVFVGDDISYDITVTNVGNVNLSNVNVSDSTIGFSAMIGSLAPGGSQTFNPTYTATSTDPVNNTAKATGNYALATVSDSADCTTTVWAPVVTKDASTSLTRTYAWTIDKVVDNPGPIPLAGGQSVDVKYTITVDLAGAPVDSGWAVSGNISVNNPAPITATINAVSDVVSPAIAAPVSCGVAFPYALAAGGTLNCTYSTPLPDASTRTNTATAALKNNNGGTSNFSGSATVNFASASVTFVDEEITVTDSFAGLLGTANALTDTLPKMFMYTRTLTAPIDVCGDVQFDNTATFTTNDTGTTGSDSATVVITVPCEGCTPGFWQGGAGSQLWNEPNDPDWTASGGQGTNPFIHTTLFNSFFTPYAPAAGITMFDLVSTGGGSEDWRKAARDVVAAYLNASWGMAFPYTPAEIAALWADAVASGDFAALHNLLAPANDPSAIGGFCPISGSF